MNCSSFRKPFKFAVRAPSSFWYQLWCTELFNFVLIELKIVLCDLGIFVCFNIQKERRMDEANPNLEECLCESYD